jgi:cyclopropane-fatty-acyl-phospholipid synthase
MDASQAAAHLFESPSRTFAVRLWDGTRLPPARDGGVRGEVVLARPAALSALAPPVTEQRLSEAYLEGDVELEGDAVELIAAAALWEGPRPRLALLPAVGTALVQRAVGTPLAMGTRLLERVLPGRDPAPRAANGEPEGVFTSRARRRLHSVTRDGEAVRHHYDLSNDFYRLFLDDSLTYSCAWFRTGAETLEEAQRAKLELICRKLSLREGERFLDVGCGWGSLLAHAARHHGVRAAGITVSENQAAEMRLALASAGTARPIEVLTTDYRDLPEGTVFDKVASIGMMEHVGRERLPAYFSGIARRLVPGGLFLNHAIADISGENTVPWASRARGTGFIERYIFPDGDLVPLRVVVSAAETAGFEVRDVESLREHYAETLVAWLGRLEARLAEAERLVGRRRARAYRLYLASSAAAFRIGRISVFQLLLARRTADGRAPGVPRCRGDWYAPAPGVH